jgi:hypothetical protein
MKYNDNCRHWSCGFIEELILGYVNRDTVFAGVSMKALAGSLALLSSLSLVAAGCGTDEADDVSSTDDALLTCNGVHQHGAFHRGHHHRRHHHHGHGGAGGSQPHLTGTGGASGSSGMAGSGMAGSTGTAGSMGTGGSGGMVDPRCAEMPDIVSWWHADGDYDDAIGANDGNTAGQVTFAPGIDQQAFNFNGMTGSFIEVPDDASLDLTSEITMDAWINTSQPGGRIFDKISAFFNDGWLLDLIGDRVRIIVGGASVQSDTPIPVGQWVHVAGTFSFSGGMSRVAVYINGALAGEAFSPQPSIPVNTRGLRFAADSDGGSLFIGEIDEPRVFSRALSADEIATLMWQTTNCQ